MEFVLSWAEWSIQRRHSFFCSCAFLITAFISSVALNPWHEALWPINLRKAPPGSHTRRGYEKPVSKSSSLHLHLTLVNKRCGP